ncbi:MAG: S9 family peptidase [Gemmatimonadetes bacterium]|nr:S9 family peptidase [Gemmatimonadota bacterium]
MHRIGRKPVRLLSGLVLLALATVAPAQTRRPMTARDLWSLGRVAAPTLSPDGSRVAYTVTRYDLETGKSQSDIWVVPTAGGEAVALTASAGSNSAPAWSPDGRWLAFVSARDGSGPQIYLLPLAGGEARALTKLADGVSGPLVWSADGKKILFTSTVWPERDAQAQRLKRLGEGKSSGRVYDELMVRHWDEWEDGKRSHVFLLDVASRETRDLTPGPYDTPPIGLGSFQDYDLSPEGEELAFVRNTDVPTAVGTGNDIWLISVDGSERRLLTQNDGNDVAPAYSPDGRYLAYLSMERAGFEADRSRLMVYDRRTGQHREVPRGLDRSVEAFVWSADSKNLYFLAQDELYHSVYRVPVSGGPAAHLTRGTYDGAVDMSADGRTLVVARQSVQMPAELFALDGSGKVLRQLTRTNDALLVELALQPAEPFWFEGAGGTRVQAFLVKPPNFDASRKYPAVFLIHGGPQSVWADSWHYRWNANLFAAPGYVAVLVNPRGSTGYGQLLTDEISGDWGGKVYEDLMEGLDHALATYPFLDANRVAAAGASYGGYMINWIEGHTDRFKALVNHDGVYDTRSMYGATEELWFVEWEFKGMPWTNPELYEQWNPARHVENFRTPMLVVHGGLDYRVPLEQGLAAFTALRRKGVPARLLYFPDEGHWVLKPHNAFVWWDTVHEWLGQYLKPTVSGE